MQQKENSKFERLFLAEKHDFAGEKSMISVLINIKYMRKYAGKLLTNSRALLTEAGF